MQEFHHEQRQASRHRSRSAAVSAGALRRRQGPGGRSRVVRGRSATRRPGRLRGQVALATADETREAIAAAAAAAPAWAATPPLQRARVLFRFKALIEREIDTLARLITAEHGKVLSDARGEVVRGMEVVEFACGIPHLLKGDYTESVGAGVDSWSPRQPRRRVRRHHAVQLPGHGPHVDVSGRDRLRQHLRAQAVGEGSELLDAARASC